MRKGEGATAARGHQDKPRLSSAPVPSSRCAASPPESTRASKTAWRASPRRKNLAPGSGGSTASRWARRCFCRSRGWRGHHRGSCSTEPRHRTTNHQRGHAIERVRRRLSRRLWHLHGQLHSVCATAATSLRDAGGSRSRLLVVDHLSDTVHVTCRAHGLSVAWTTACASRPRAARC